MAVNFPINPTPGQSYTAEGGTWVWNGSQWTVHGGGITEGDADLRYLKLTGGTLTGTLVAMANVASVPALAANNSYLLVRRFDNTNNGALFHVAATDEVILHKRAADGLTTQSELRFSATDLRLTGLSATIPAADSVLNRDRGDARYHRLNTSIEALNTFGVTPASATVNAHLYFRRFNATSAGLLYYDYALDEIELRKYDAAGTGAQTSIRLKTNDVIIGGGTPLAAPVAASIMTMARADARYLSPAEGDAAYLKLSGGTVSGGVNVVGTLVVKPAVSGNALLYLQRSDGSPAGLFYHSPTSEFVELRKHAASGGGTTQIQLWDNDIVASGGTITTSAPSTTSLMTRQRGDARYLGLTGGTIEGTANNWTGFGLQKSAVDMASTLQFRDAGGQTRWTLTHAANANAGLFVQRYDAAGAFQSNMMVFQSDNNIITYGAPYLIPPSGEANYIARASAIGGLIVQDGGGANRGRLYWNMTNAAMYLQIMPGGNTLSLEGAGLVLTSGVYLSAGIAGYGAALRVRDGSNRASFDWRSPNSLINISDSVEMVIGTASDYRLKDEIGGIDSPLDLIDQLRPLRYHIKQAVGFEAVGADDPVTEHHGLIAHEVQELIPSIVMGEKDGDMLQSVNYAGLVPLLIAAIQELKAKVAALEAA